VTRASISIFVLALVALTACSKASASASNIYIAQSAAGSANGTSCANAYAYTFFNTSGNWGSGSAQIGPGTTVHLCGTITGAANATGLTFQGSGTNGSPITLLFEAGAIMQAPYWSASVGGQSKGAISMGTGYSYLIVDGGSNGIIQNTANGSPSRYPNQAASTGVSGFACNSCIVRNLQIVNLYVNVSGDGTLGDNSVVRAIDFNGSNWAIYNNTIHDCGWCVFDVFANGDTNTQIYNNNIYNFGHAVAYATGNASTCASPCLQMNSNHVHDAGNWSGPGCPFHQDGLHTFATSGAVITDVYLSNNLFDGDWGTCPTGFVFFEGGSSSTPSHLQHLYMWNNVGVVVNPNFINTNGWFGLFSGEAIPSMVVNNTVVGNNATDNTFCMSIGGISGLVFENNVVSPCGNPLTISGATLGSVDYNFYGPSCLNGSNCFVWNNSYTGSLSNWRGACGCDAHSIQNNTPALNPDGSPLAGSPVGTVGVNLASRAVGYLTSLSNDTSEGNTRTPLPRPANGPWAAGAFVVPGMTTGGPGPGPAAPTGLTAVVR